MPHVHCLFGNRQLMLLHATSDLLIGFSYLAISATLAYLVYRARRETPLSSMLLACAVFVIGYGITHFVEVWSLWAPASWLSGGVKAIAATAAVITAVSLPPLVPRTLKLVRDAGLSERRRLEVEAANQELHRLYERLDELDGLRSQLSPNRSHELRAPLTLIAGPAEPQGSAGVSQGGGIEQGPRELGIAVTSPHIARDQEHAGLVKTNFLRLVSHELRTPLTAITLQLQLLQRRRSGSLHIAEQESLRKMTLAADRLDELITSLLEHARIESGRLIVAQAPLDLTALVSGVVRELEPRAALRNLELRYEAAPDVPALVSDIRLVRLILANLVDNAIKFTASGHVQVKISQEGGMHQISVSDTGPGIAIQNQESIFLPFEQLEAVSHKHTPGLGLGLTLVRQLAHAIGGRIELISEEGLGSTFTVHLPSAADWKP